MQFQWGPLQEPDPVYPGAKKQRWVPGSGDVWTSLDTPSLVSDGSQELLPLAAGHNFRLERRRGLTIRPIPRRKLSRSCLEMLSDGVFPETASQIQDKGHCCLTECMTWQWPTLVAQATWSQVEA